MKRKNDLKMNYFNNHKIGWLFYFICATTLLSACNSKENTKSCECKSLPDVKLQVFIEEENGSLRELNGFDNNPIFHTSRNSTLVVKIIGEDSEGLLDVDFDYDIYEYCQSYEGNNWTHGTIEKELQITANGSNPPTQIIGEFKIEINKVKIESCTQGGKLANFHRGLELYGKARNICGQESKTKRWRWWFKLS